MKTIEEALKLLIGEDKINEAIDLNKKYKGVFDAQGDIVMAQADNIKDLLDKITEKAEHYPSDIYSEVVIDNTSFIEELEGNVFQEFLNDESDDYFAFNETISITWVGLDGYDDDDKLFISFQKNGGPDKQFPEDINEEKNNDKIFEDEHAKPKGLMIWTKAGADDYHADWINVPANITLEQFKALLMANGYEIHDYSEDDKAWWGDDTGVKFCIELGSAARWWRFSSLEGCMNWFKAGNANTFKNSGTDDILDEDADYILTEKYSDEELDDMIGNVYNIQKITNIFRRKKYDDKRLFARTVCTNCGREKTVFLSNLINDPDKYGSCICSDTNLDAKLDTIDALYSGRKKLASNTSGYTGVSFVKTYKGEPYNKWRAYIEVDGVRTYLGDFTSKSKAIKARKEAGEKGIKWYKDNRNKLMRDIRRKSKKYKTSKYRETQKTRSYAKLKKKK